MLGKHESDALSRPQHNYDMCPSLRELGLCQRQRFEVHARRERIIIGQTSGRGPRRGRTWSGSREGAPDARESPGQGETDAKKSARAQVASEARPGAPDASTASTSVSRSLAEQRAHQGDCGAEQVCFLGPRGDRALRAEAVPLRLEEAAETAADARRSKVTSTRPTRLKGRRGLRLS